MNRRPLVFYRIWPAITQKNPAARRHSVCGNHPCADFGSFSAGVRHRLRAASGAIEEVGDAILGIVRTVGKVEQV